MKSDKQMLRGKTRQILMVVLLALIAIGVSSCASGYGKKKYRYGSCSVE